MAFTAVTVTVTKHTIPNQHYMETFYTEFHLYRSRQTKCGYKFIFTIK